MAHPPFLPVYSTSQVDEENSQSNVGAHKRTKIINLLQLILHPNSEYPRILDMKNQAIHSERISWRPCLDFLIL